MKKHSGLILETGMFNELLSIIVNILKHLQQVIQWLGS